MKKKVIIDLIKSHYKQEHQAFFNNCLEVLKEFKETDKLIFEDLSNFLKQYVIVRPKKEYNYTSPEITFDDAEIVGWTLVPQEESKND